MSLPAQIRLWATWMLAIVASGCGPGLLDDALFTDTEPMAKDTDTIVPFNTWPDTDSLPAAAICPGEITKQCTSSKLYTSPVFILASTEWLDTPARFTHLNQDVILGYYKNESNTPFAIQLDFANVIFPDDFDAYGRVMTFDTPEIGGEWIGVVSASRTFFDSEYRYLGVLKSGNKYQLTGIPRRVDDTGLGFLDMPALQTDAVLGGVVFPAGKTTQDDPSLNVICLFGEGVFCFDGEQWVTELAPDIDDFIVSMEVTEMQGHPALYAVAENGVIYTRLKNSWSRFVIEDAPVLTTSGTNETTGLLTVAGDGILARGDGRHLMFSCDINLDIKLFQYYRDSAEFLLFTQDGDIYSGEFDATNEPAICGPLRHIDDIIDFYPYGMNYYVLTSNALYGTEDNNNIVVE